MISQSLRRTRRLAEVLRAHGKVCAIAVAMAFTCTFSCSSKTEVRNEDDDQASGGGAGESSTSGSGGSSGSDGMSGGSGGDTSAATGSGGSGGNDASGGTTGTGGSGGSGGGGDSGGTGGTAGTGGSGGGPVECESPSDCGWSLCDEGRCAAAVHVHGGQSGARCAVRDVGDVLCWGLQSSGLLGDVQDTVGLISDPSWVVGLDGEGLLEDAVKVGVSGSYACALLESGRVACWGADSGGVLGRGSVNGSGSVESPGFVTGLSGSGALESVVDLSVSRTGHACALRESGDVVCWGSNANGQVGNGTTAAAGIPQLVTGVGGVGTLSSVAQIATGQAHSCARDEDGQVYCWGSSQFAVVPSQSTTPVEIVGVGDSGTLDNAVHISVGSATCAVLDTSEVACWGQNSNGQLGRGEDTTTTTSIPELVLNPEGDAPLDSIAAVDSEGNRVCALDDGGGVLCWGLNNTNGLGIGSSGPDTSNLPVQVLGIDGAGMLSDVESLGSGFGFTCAVLSGGRLACWGLVGEIFEPEYELVTSAFPALVSAPEP